jgi:Tol biopolymer transport system component
MFAQSTTRVSVDSSGAQADGPSTWPVMSTDSRYVAFESTGTNLVAADTNAVRDVFVRDLHTSTTTRVSVSSGGIEGDRPSLYPSVSGDGRYVAFTSDATNLVVGDTNDVGDVFLHDIQLGTTTPVSVNPGGTLGNGGSYFGTISADGRYVAFTSSASDLVSGDTNGFADVFVRDLQMGSTVRVSLGSVSVEGNAASGYSFSGENPLSISSDGHYVAFQSLASNLVTGDSNAVGDIFVRDLQTGTTTRVATNLVAGDANGQRDVFLRDRGAPSAYTHFCFGDGSGAYCPCANSGGVARGCQNSAGTGGALLTVSGMASLAADSVQFISAGELPSALSIVLQGNTAIGSVNYGDGLRCAGGALKRLYVKSAIGGVVFAPQAGDPSVSARSAALGAPIPLGASRIYQVYYRDPSASFCPAPLGSTFNVSNGIAVAWGD